MFTWKIEENKLNKERTMCKRNRYNGDYCFDAEDVTSREEKIEFVDSLTDGALTYLINLAAKFEEDKANGKLKVGEWNYVKKNSLLAWLKRNDTRSMIDQRFEVGKVFALSLSGKYRLTFPVREIESFNQKGGYDHYADYADEAFHRVLLDLANEEQKYFEEHDEYTLLEKEARKYIDRFGNFGTHLSIWSSKGLVISPEGDTDTDRKLTVEELNSLIEKGKKAEALISELSKDPIKY